MSEENKKEKTKENLSEMISVSFTPTQEQALEKASSVAGFEKVGTYARWLIVNHLREHGFLDVNLPSTSEEDEQ